MPNPRVRRATQRLMLPVSIAVLSIVVCLSACSTPARNGSPPNTSASAASSPRVPLSIAIGKIRLISAWISAASAAHRVFLNTTLVNDNARPVVLTGVDAASVSAEDILARTIPPYDESVMTGSRRLAIGTARRDLLPGNTLRLTLRFRSHAPITVEVPVS